ncbi:MAG: tetratricopeptide repeat protein [Pyrinomonadaceae bacterium]
MKKFVSTPGLVLVAALYSAPLLLAQDDPKQASSATVASAPMSQAEALQSGQIDAALAALSPLLSADAKDVRVNYLLGSAYYQKSDFTRTIEHLSLAMPQLPLDSQPHAERATSGPGTLLFRPLKRSAAAA